MLRRVVFVGLPGLADDNTRVEPWPTLNQDSMRHDHDHHEDMHVGPLDIEISSKLGEALGLFI